MRERLFFLRVSINFFLPFHGHEILQVSKHTHVEAESPLGQFQLHEQLDVLGLDPTDDLVRVHRVEWVDDEPVNFVLWHAHLYI